ncbi:MAG: hypothetical protein KF713_16185 [Turneriella sp.]|nr:hypothetical protein [Turneriella sp.]
MEYVAFLFLGLGVLLVLAGVLLQVREKQNGGSTPFDDYLNKTGSSAVKIEPFKALAATPAAQPQPVIAPLAAAQPEPAVPAYAGHAVPGPFQFVKDEPPPPPPQPVQPPVAVKVQQNNPRLFEKFAYLYLDSSQRNIYDGAGSAVAFDLSEVSGIRRFGRGVFAYDGFSFYFDHTSGQERFPLANLKTVGFYPNCVALTFRTHQPVALLFMEETESIRKVLETFRSPV